MTTTSKVSFHADTVVSALVLGHEESDWRSLAEIFEEMSWTLWVAPTAEQGVALADEQVVPVVVAPHELWQQEAGWLAAALRHSRGAKESGAPPKVVLTHRFSEAPNLPEALLQGAYDWLAMPFERGEVVQVVGFAWLQWKRERERALMRVVPIRVAVG